MLVYRITTEIYAQKLTASRSGSRWNQEGEFVVYTADSRSLASLELVVHIAFIEPKINYKVLVIQIDVTKSQIDLIEKDDISEKLKNIASYNKLQLVGSNW